MRHAIVRPKVAIRSRTSVASDGALMTTIAQHQFSDLLADRAGPCISLYLPTDRRFPDRKQNAVRFRNLLREAEQSLASSGTPLTDDERTALVAPLHTLAANDRFWHHTQDGLAVVRAPDYFKVFKLQQAVPARAVVAESFHIKPLLRVLQSAERFEVLAISREHVRLFQGTRDRLDEIELDASVPRSLTEALGDELTEPYSATRTVTASSAIGSGTAVHSGSGSKSDESEKDIVRYFRIVDRALLDSHARTSASPLVLAALPEYHAVFRETSRNPHLVAQAVAGNPDALSIDELRHRAWAIVAPGVETHLRMVLDEFHAGLPRLLATDDLAAVAVALIGGRVKTLLVDANRVVPGAVDRTTGLVTHSQLHDPHVNDILDDLAELALRFGGDVVVLPQDRMPGRTGVAAICRF